MAAAVRISAVGGSSSGTGDRSATIVPASGDLLVVYCCVAANANNAPTCSDNNGAGTYDLIEILNFAIAGIDYRMSVFIRTALMVNTTSTVVTVATGSNSSGAVHVLAVTGVTRTGANAVRSEGSQNNQAAATAAPTLNQAALTNNGTLVAHGSADTTTTPPTNWTEIQDTNFSNDTVALETAFRASGFTGTTITFGAASSTQFCAHAMELDITAPLTQSAADDVNNLADARGLGYGNLHADSVATLADTATVVIGYVLPISDDTNNLADGTVKVIGALLSPVDSLQALTEALVKLLSYQLALADSEAANWADAHQLLLAQFLALADAYTLTDATTVLLEQRVGFTETLNPLSDALALQIGGILELDDNADVLADSSSLRLAHFLSLSDGGPDFPSTAILDDFNRADEGPPPSSNWTTGVAFGFEGFAEPGFAVSSNQLFNIGNDVAQQYWNAQQFGPDCEAYITLANSSDLRSMALTARLTNIGEFTTEGYAAQVNFSDINGGSNNYQILKITNGSLTLLTSRTELVAGTPVSGHKYGIRCVSDEIQFWADMGSGWELKTHVTDSSYQTAGFIGINTESNINSRQDDFGGGTVAPRFNDSVSSELSTGPIITEQLSDSLALTSSLGLGHGFVIADTLDQQADAVDLQLGTLLPFSDPLVLTDAETHVLTQRLQFTDNADALVDEVTLHLGHLFTIGDALPTHIDYATACLFLLGIEIECVDSDAHIGLEFYDSIQLTDSAAFVLGQLAGFSDSFVITDTETHTLELQLTFAESIALTDSATLGLGLSFAESVTLTDAIALRLDQQLLLTDDIATLADAAILRLVHLLALTDTITVTDACSIVLGHNQSLSDTIANLSDVETAVLGQLLSFTDSITLTDAETHTVAITLNFSDAIALTDSIALGYGLLVTDDTNLLSDAVLTSAPQGPLRQVGVTDALATLTEAVALELGQRVAITDTISLTDAVTLNEGMFTVLSDALALTDTIAATLGHLLSSVDTLTLNDSAQLRLGQELAIADTIALTDTATLNLGYNLPLADNASLLADSVVKSLGLTLIIADNGPTLTDAVSFFSVSQLRLAETLVLTDALSKSAAGFLPLDDALLLADSAAVDLRGPDLEEALADGLALTDAITISLNNELQLQVATSDTLTLTDHYFDLRYPYIPSVKRHVVVSSRARETVVPAREVVKVPPNNRTMRPE